jgi:hypothetical protein
MRKLKENSGGILLAVTIALVLSSCGADSERKEAPAGFTTAPALVPAFSWDQSDYAVRCRDQRVEFSFDLPEGWRGRVGNSSLESGASQIGLPMEQGRQRVVSLRGPGLDRARNFHVRCLPDDFPPFRVSSSGDGGPRLTVVELLANYVAAFDSRGAPVWWYKATGLTGNAQFMADGTVSYVPTNGVIGREFEVRTLEGRLVRTLVAAGGLRTDIHDLALLPNGNYLLGAHRIVDGVDTSPFGGARDASVDTAQVQELRPDGSLVWKWDAWPRIGPAESGRWWKQLREGGQPYDLHHWNSVDRRGNYVLLSFRHLDAIYRIDRRTGRIVWKLGGTRTREQLDISGDPNGEYPFGGPHDARILPGNSVTLFDNDTDLDATNQTLTPRALSYRINPADGSAELTGEITDPRVERSIGFGSTRLYGDGNWLVGWGARSTNGLIGGYRSDGKPIFSLVTPGGVSYRANEVTSPRPSLERLRLAMDRMYAKGR